MPVLTSVLFLLSSFSGARAASVTIGNVQVSRDTFLAHSEPAIAENPRNPNNLIAGSKFFTDPAHYQFKIGTFYSMDGGRTWHDSGVLPGFTGYETVSDVSIAFSATGTAYVSVLALSGQRSGIFVSRSTDGGKTFSAPAPVFLDQTGATFSDKPWIAVDTSNRKTAGTIYVAWNLDSTQDAKGQDPGRFLVPQQSVDNPPVGLVVSHSTDGGRTFSSPIIISDFTDTQFEIGAIPAVGPGGSLYIVYGSINAHGDLDALDMVTSGDGGVTFSPPSTVAAVDGLPNHLPNSTFRNLSLPTFAISPKDASMVVAWADMRNGDADILEVHSTNHGHSWSAPVRVNGDKVGNGKDQFMPALAAAPNGTFTCAWFDRRHDPHNRLIDEEVAQSTNDGASFGRNLRVTRKSWDPSVDAPLPEGKKTNTFIGDYQALAADNLTVHPLWNDTQDGKSQQIRTAVISERLFLRP